MTVKNKKRIHHHEEFVPAKKIVKSYKKQNFILIALLLMAVAGILLYPYSKKVKHDQETSSRNTFYSNFRYTENFDNGQMDQNAWKIDEKNTQSVQVKNSNLAVNMTNINASLKLTYSKEMTSNFKISFDLDLKNFNNGKIVLNLFNEAAKKVSGFDLEFVPVGENVGLRANSYNSKVIRKIGEVELPRNKEYNLKIARMGSNIYFGFDGEAIGVLTSIYEGAVIPELEFTNSNRGPSEVYLDNFYLEDVF